MQTEQEITAPLVVTRLGRGVAIAQQLKDTLIILGMNFMLLFGILFYGIAVPGLVLYALRWRLVRGKSSPRRALAVWSFTFVHEVLCVLLFQSADMQSELMNGAAQLLSFGYLLGVGFSLVGLAEAVSSLQKTRDSTYQ